MAGVSQTEGGGTGPADSGAERDGRHRLLVVATTVVEGSALRDQVERHAGDRSSAIHVVAPALAGSALKHAMGDVDEPAAEAHELLEASLEEIRGGGREVTGTVGDSDPLLAIEDALQVFAADEILIVTHPDEDATWLEGDLFDRAKAKFEPPITHVIVGEGSADTEVGEVEHAGRGVEAPEDEIGPESGNQPRVSKRNLAGLVIAIVGTIVAVVLAASCGKVEEGSGTSTACIASILIAGALGLINAAHIVGLLLFESAGYRGGWARMFSLMSLILTPTAIVVLLILQ